MAVIQQCPNGAIADKEIVGLPVVSIFFFYTASLGTTKYCSTYLKNQQCHKSDCMYLHELAEEEASFTKEDMQVTMKLNFFYILLVYFM